MPRNYRIRYSMKPAGQHSNAEVQSTDLLTDLDQIPALLPASAYIMYIEDLTNGQNVHWTRWPNSFRPGFGDSGGN